MLQGVFVPHPFPHPPPCYCWKSHIIGHFRIGIKHQNHPLRGSLRITPYSFIILQATGAFGPRTLVSDKDEQEARLPDTWPDTPDLKALPREAVKGLERCIFKF